MTTPDFSIRSWDFSATEATVLCLSSKARAYMGGASSFTITLSALPKAVEAMEAAGWTVAEGGAA